MNEALLLEAGVFGLNGSDHPADTLDRAQVAEREEARPQAIVDVMVVVGDVVGDGRDLRLGPTQRC